MVGFIVWKGSWFWLFTHFGAIKCVKSQNQLPLHSKMLNSSDCCEGSVLTEVIWIISEKWKWNFKCMSMFQKFASVCSCQWKWKDVCFCSSRRLLQKSGLKMGPVDTSEMVDMNMLCKTHFIEANQAISARKRHNAAWSPSFHPLHFPLHAGDHHGFLH